MSAVHYPNPAHVDPALLARYTTRGPRYTSYPTAPHFAADVDRSELFARYEASNAAPAAGLSLYFHIPFCFRRCLFCGCFTTIASHPEAADPYLLDLGLELELLTRRIDPARPVMQLAFGGGSPNFLTAERFDALLTRLASLYTLHPQAERSIEIDPRRVSTEQIEVWLAHGFNRFSMGVQDLDEGVQKILHREQSYEKTLALVAALRARGQEAINFDLIYGLPGQTLATMRRTIRRVIEIGPSRLALYSYAQVPWIQRHQKALERHPTPNPSEKLALFGVAFEELTAAGYVPIGMDHFAKESDELVIAQRAKSLHRNFMGYTTRRGLDQVGFGVSAISHVARTYHQNTKDFALYRERLGAGEIPTERGFLLSADDALRHELISELFCNFELDGAALGARAGIDFAAYFAPELAELTPFVADGLIETAGSQLTITPLGRAFVRNVCMVFDRYLETDLKERRYSQTV